MNFKKLYLLVFLLVMFVGSSFSDLILTNCDSLMSKNLLELSKDDESSVVLSAVDDFSDFTEGVGALKVQASFSDIANSWGSWADMLYSFGAVKSFLGQTELVFYIKAVQKPANPQDFYFAVYFYDSLSTSPSKELWQYEDDGELFSNIGDGWQEVRFPLSEFVIPDWYKEEGELNNEKFDLSSIVSMGFSFGPLTNNADSLVFLLDNVHLESEGLDFYVFYKDAPPIGGFITNGWSGGTVNSEYTDDVYQGEKAIYWTGSDAWDGPTINLPNPVDLSVLREEDDTLYFAIKVQENTPYINVVLGDDDYDGPGPDQAYDIELALDSTFYKADGQWHEVKVPLQMFPDTGSFWVSEEVTLYGAADYTRINRITFTTAEGLLGGEVVLLDYIHAGIEVIDSIPPASPANVNVDVSNKYMNIISWSDVDGESNEIYNVYYSSQPISSLEQDGVHLLKEAIGEGIGTFVHKIESPINDKEVTYYYVVTAVDQSGNESAPSNSIAATNIARGVQAIMPPPEDFELDGDVIEWEEGGYWAWELSVEQGTAYNTSSTNLVENDNDCSARVWVAMDNENLYVAAAVVDDSLYFPYEGEQTWMNDAVEVYLGLYPYPDKLHSTYMRGAEPDYQIRFTRGAKAWLYNGYSGLDVNLAETVIEEAVDFSGYYVEATIPLAALTTADPEHPDSVYVPVNGMKIPFDIVILDAPTIGNELFDKGLDLSGVAPGTGWQTPSAWTSTYVLTEFVEKTDVNENHIINKNKTVLSQNYPNPFNPTTKVKFTLAKESKVSLIVYNVLGQKVLEPIKNKNMAPGTYEQLIDMGRFNSGVYFYRLKYDDKTLTKKMVLLK